MLLDFINPQASKSRILEQFQETFRECQDQRLQHDIPATIPIAATINPPSGWIQSVPCEEHHNPNLQPMGSWRDPAYLFQYLVPCTNTGRSSPLTRHTPSYRGTAVHGPNLYDAHLQQPPMGLLGPTQSIHPLSKSTIKPPWPSCPFENIPFAPVTTNAPPPPS